MNLKEATKICNEYYNLTRNNVYGTYAPYEMMSVCEKLAALGLEWGDPINYEDFYICKGNDYHLSNSATHYKFDKNTYYIHWDNGNIGKYQFVGDFGYHLIDDEWNEFKEILMSYKPLDYDSYNCHIIYDVENGKRLIKDYKDICKRVKEKVAKKVKEAQIQKKLKEIDALKKQLEGGV